MFEEVSMHIMPFVEARGNFRSKKEGCYLEKQQRPGEVRVLEATEMSKVLK